MLSGAPKARSRSTKHEARSTKHEARTTNHEPRIASHEWGRCGLAEEASLVVRIVSLLPSATEIVYALGLGDALVGVTHECDFPEAAKTKPILTASALPHAAKSADIDRHVRANLHAGSSLYTLDSELLERLQPDLIITQELCEVCAVSYHIVATAARRLSGDPRLISLEPSSLEDVYANIATVAELAGVPERTDGVVGPLRARIAILQAQIHARPRKKTLVLEWTDPPMSGGHWTPGLVEISGGEPILANPGANSTVISWEAIAAADPDDIIVAPCGFDLARTHQAIADLVAVPQWSALRAVACGRVHAIDGNAFVNRPGPRLVDTAELFAAALATS
jgi:iron complex transport system substrate-binding protein